VFEAGSKTTPAMARFGSTAFEPVRFTHVEAVFEVQAKVAEFAAAAVQFAPVKTLLDHCTLPSEVPRITEPGLLCATLIEIASPLPFVRSAVVTFVHVPPPLTLAQALFVPRTTLPQVVAVQFH
jgi:hypothetical protein